tara:strand:- start:87 stop:1499 length:1413 start_codon:yes stop_codon:yes gene_type:complete
VNNFNSISKYSFSATVALIVLLLFFNRYTDKINTYKITENNLPKDSVLVVSRLEYKEKLHGFWLGQCIANWTGLVTEMDKIGNIGDIKTGDFYTMEDWGKPDQPNIWSRDPSDLSSTIDFVFAGKDDIWGADDDTDIEYMYQYLHSVNNASILSGEQIRDGWLRHIKKEEENYLWVSNQTAFDLMQKGMTPPETSLPENNPHYEMIDAQLTTEIFGLFAPGRPDIALELATLPIGVTARFESEWIAKFYVIMHSLASYETSHLTINNKLRWMANEARKIFPNNSYPAKMYDFVKKRHQEGIAWEVTRDMVYDRYQVNQDDGYDITSRNLHCNGCFASGINFAASIISLLYGEGEIKKTIQVGALCGWDSDNPTATWGGLIGFMIGKKGVETAFGRTFSEKYNIHRTRIGFPNNGIDTFTNMAEQGIHIVDKTVQRVMGGTVDYEKDLWYIPYSQNNLKTQKYGVIETTEE